MLVSPAIATRLVSAGGSGSTFCINEHVSISLMHTVYVGHINENSDYDGRMLKKKAKEDQNTEHCVSV